MSQSTHLTDRQTDRHMSITIACVTASQSHAKNENTHLHIEEKYHVFVWDIQYLGLLVVTLDFCDNLSVCIAYALSVFAALSGHNTDMD